MTLWLVTAFDRSVDGPYVTDGALLEADDEATAAQLGRDWLHGNALDDWEPDTLFVWQLPEERTAYEVWRAVRPAELQCCGGLDGSERHTATCPTERKGAATS